MEQDCWGKPNCPAGQGCLSPATVRYFNCSNAVRSSVGSLLQPTRFLLHVVSLAINSRGFARTAWQPLLTYA